MRLFVTLISLVSLIMFAGYSGADTIKLKSGRTIKASKCWENGDQVKCKVQGGATIGFQKKDVVSVLKDFKVPKLLPQSFSFGVWQSGITVHEAINAAEYNNLPLHRDGLISENKTFDPAMCRPYADSATKFYYEEKIYGKWAIIYLGFTPSGKKLYSLNVRFLNTGVSKDSKFRISIEEKLKKKYGEPLSNKSNEEQRYIWKISEIASVTMHPGSNYVLLSFFDNSIAKSVETELSNQVNKGATESHKSKF
ncbi:hypothetical protein DESC_60005 [Desulfosarcina cetonica]|uniref:hypothetical protein n=1 Tax=Desulfosarcina cetonica TaxID=90730 RepID=UPI0006D1C0CE|nr:hypothetical protein [Desulfosarcina cetonica]VTR67265.1 hypothetical protein DESC_60005 [Desulfosarcina cetonica]